ncbi:FtsK/SpoIIIE domain-containing protein [Janibacter sp. YB324]|uniref:FtsK/SpoIIIE domain-containing protein n=1 Tax=Janibacter sp. YB324 TaxID=2761047 RepID=UPI0016290465|nr:FtsK/SpoIIIE domain-containing protein [Janibacter sp. YB324]QNF93348.1 FHA domain-containing protein [Janibacter sp. YB324]
MQLRMTIIDTGSGGPETIDVRAEAHHTLGDLLAATGHAPATATVRGEALAPDAPLGLPPLLDGAELIVGATDTAATEASRAPLRLVSLSGPDAGRTLELTPGRHTIGRGDAATMRVADDALSREHVELTVDRDGVHVRDLGTTNGTTVDEAPLPTDGARVRSGSRVIAGHTTFAVEAHRQRPARRTPSGDGTLAVNPTPHLPQPTAPATIRLPPEPTASARRRIPWLMVLLPLPFAGLLALFFGPRMLLFGLLSPLLVLGSTLSDRTTSRREHREAHAQWVRDRAATGERLAAALRAERRHRLRSAPDASALLDAARGDSARLWERRPQHDEHLCLRLGLGALPAMIEVEHRAGAREHPVLDDVPLSVDLAEVGVLGIAGRPATRDRLARHLLGQLTALHSHHDVQVSVVGDDDGWWSPFAGLVHLRAHDDVPESARIATDRESGAALLAGLARLAAERATTAPERRREGDPLPVAHVVVVDGVGDRRTDPGLRTIMSEGGPARVLVIALADTPDQLPHEARAVAALDGDRVRLLVAGQEAASGVVDGTGDAWARRLAAALTPLRDATPDARGGALPGAARLVDLLDRSPDDADAVVGRWRGERGVDLEVTVGAAGEGDFRIDLRRDGPHALVAGTTGSGKSEFLQSWVASLAAHLSPQEMTFVLVDYKGGAAFAECARLPHTVGMLTDLDPAAAERALTSLDAELTRREHVLAASGAKDIDDHRGDPLPRLMIVIDEFRMLAEEQPDVMAHLMRIAAVGRSLGVHLVLATQRPGGIVSADIKANVNLRIALRVRDRADSDDVIGCPDAAEIPETAPGRALASTGGGPPRAFQTGRVAGHAAGVGGALLVRRPDEAWPAPPVVDDLGPTDLQRLARTMTRVAQSLAIPAPHRPWLPPLPETIEAARLPDDEVTGAPFGLVDLPAQQRQSRLEWATTDGHWMLVGCPGSGRTTALASLVTAAAHRWSADRLQVQVVGDGSARLAGLSALPHVGSIVDGEAATVVGRFLERLESDLSTRRAALRASGHPTLDAWWATHEGEGGPPPPPHLLLAIDGWGRVTRPRGSLDLGETAESLETLMRDGVALGLRVVVAGGRELLSGRVSSLVGTRLVLHLSDRGDAALAGLTRTEVSDRLVPGRARLQPGGDLAQVALPSLAPSGGGEATMPPWVVEELPGSVPLDVLPAAARERIPLGLGGSGRDPVVWRADGARRFLVCGPPRSGRSTALSLLARQVAASGQPLVVVGSGAIADGLDCPVLGADDRDELIALRQRHPDLAVIADDLDRLEGAAVADVLKEILRRLDADRGLVIGATATQTAVGQVRGLVSDLARTRTGLLLQPSARSDGDALGLRVPPLPRVAGRGYLVVDGAADEVQVALPRVEVPTTG